MTSKCKGIYKILKILIKSILFLSINVKNHNVLGGIAMSKELFDTFKFKCGAELKNRVLMAPMTIKLDILMEVLHQK